MDDDNKILENGKSGFDGGLLGLIGINIASFLICILTLGIGVPWAIVLKYKWKLSHTVYNGRRLSFDGTGGQLIGSYFLWLFLAVITIGVYVVFMPIKIRQWKVKHTHFIDGETIGDSKFNGRAFGLLGTNLLCYFLIIITLSLALPSTIAIKQRWETEHTTIDGYRLKFFGRGAGLFGNYLKWILLTIVTFSIFALWIPLKLENWRVKNTRFVNPHIERYIDKYSQEWYEAKYTDEKAKTHHVKSMVLLNTILAIVAICTLSLNLYDLINYVRPYADNWSWVISSLLHLATQYISGINLVYLLLSIIFILIVGLSLIMKLHAKSNYQILLHITGYAIIFIQSSSFLNDIINDYNYSNSNSVIYTTILILVLETITLPVLLFVICYFVKKYLDIASGCENNVSSHIKLKCLSGLIVIVTAILLVMSIVWTFDSRHYHYYLMSLNCALCTFISVVILINDVNDLPYNYKIITRAKSVSDANAAPIIEKVE